MKNYDLILLTDARYVKPKVINDYTKNILDEDDLVLKALVKRGLRVARVDWANKKFDWASTNSAVFRTTWDYFDRFEEFISWINKTKHLLRFINPVEMVLWNIDKHYLRDLNSRGVNIPETRFIEIGDKTNLQEILLANNWSDAILKPAISGSARHTYRISPDNCWQIEPVFQSLIKAEAMLVQPLVQSVIERGEVALMFFDGKYSHAVLKIAKKGDFRVQDDFGGTVHDYTPTADEIKLGEQALHACVSTPIYARVDVINDNNGNPAVTELELIEPELWFRHKPAAADSFANAVVKYIDAS